VSRFVALSLAVLAPDLNTPAKWLTGALAIAGSALAWRFAAWLYADFVRPRLDRFVRDSRLRSGADDDAITLGILSRNGGAFDDHIIGALDREAERFATAVGDALTARSPSARAKCAARSKSCARSCSADRPRGSTSAGTARCAAPRTPPPPR
jgi:hypothetical protein